MDSNNDDKLQHLNIVLFIVFYRSLVQNSYRLYCTIYLFDAFLNVFGRKSIKELNQKLENIENV